MKETIATEARNAGLEDILTMLQEQRARRLDVVVRQPMIDAHDGNILVRAGESTQWVSDEGVTSAAGLYRPTAVGDEGLAQLLGIDGGFLKKLRRLDPGRTDLWDVLVNGMLHGAVSEDAWTWDEASGQRVPPYPPYDGAILLRLLKGDEAVDGVLRAALSPRYKIIDNLDVLLAVMDGLRRAGVNAIPDVSDLTDRRMHVRFSVPEIAAYAPQLLEGYRSPFDGPGGVQRAGHGDRPGMKLQAGHFGAGGAALQRALAAAKQEGKDYPPGQEPVVFAGLKVTNSDVGEGARSIAPEIVVQICGNRLTLTASADRAVHLGSQKDEGVIRWSAETAEKELQLITSQAADAVSTFLTPEWFFGKVAEIEALAGVPVAEPEQVIKDVSKAAGFTQGEQADILAHFFRGGSFTSGGVANAVTSVSQTLENADRAAELDAKAVPVMEHAARLAR
jgi:hypothetical protein